MCKSNHILNRYYDPRWLFNQYQNHKDRRVHCANSQGPCPGLSGLSWAQDMISSRRSSNSVVIFSVIHTVMMRGIQISSGQRRSYSDCNETIGIQSVCCNNVNLWVLKSTFEQSKRCLVIPLLCIH